MASLNSVDIGLVLINRTNECWLISEVPGSSRECNFTASAQVSNDEFEKYTSEFILTSSRVYCVKVYTKCDTAVGIDDMNTAPCKYTYLNIQICICVYC